MFLLLCIFSVIVVMCTNKVSVSIGISVVLMCLYGSSKRTDFTLVLWRSIVALVGAEIEVSIFKLKSFDIYPCLWLLWRGCSLSVFFFTDNCPLKGDVSNFLLFWINNSLIPLLLIPHPRKSYFRYVVEEFLGLWMDICWYCWPVVLCICWSLFGSF